jgi:hypothetical protein
MLSTIPSTILSTIPSTPRRAISSIHRSSVAGRPAPVGHGMRLGGRFRAVAVAILSMLAAFTGTGAEAAVPGVRPLATRPPAVPGEPLLVPVSVEGAGTGAARVEFEYTNALGAEVRTRGEARLLWPVRPDADRADAFDPTTTRGLSDASATAAAGSADGIAPPPRAGVGVLPPSTRRWAVSSNELRLRAERPGGARDAYLAVDVPADAGSGLRVRIDGTLVTPVVLDAPPTEFLAKLAERMSSIAPEGAPDALLSLPDPAAPFERFRFVLGAALRGWPMPEPLEPSSPDAIAARATSALWIAALARLASASEGTAAELAELLVAQCKDATSPAPIAAWIVDPRELATVLSLALDSSRTPAQAVESVVSWMRVRSPLLVWIDDDDREGVTLAIANPGSVEETVRFQWLVESEPPLAALVGPAEVTRVRLARPAAASIDGTPIQRDVTDTLRLEHREQVRRIAVPPALLPAALDGVTFARFRAPLDLLAVATGATEAPSASGAVATIRPRLAGWEVFAEVRVAIPGLAADRIAIAGPEGAVVTIAGDGSLDDPTDALAGAAGLSFRSYPDRFRVSFPVPPSWIERVGASGLVALGFRHDDASGSRDAPYASVPWRREPRRLRVDILSRGQESRGESVYSPP